MEVAPGESARPGKVPAFGPSPALARDVSLRSTPRATAISFGVQAGSVLTRMITNRLRLGRLPMLRRDTSRCHRVAEARCRRQTPARFRTRTHPRRAAVRHSGRAPQYRAHATNRGSRATELRPRCGRAEGALRTSLPDGTGARHQPPKLSFARNTEGSYYIRRAALPCSRGYKRKRRHRGRKTDPSFGCRLLRG